PQRSDDWVKIKRSRENDLVVVGWEESDKEVRGVRSLILAAHDGTELVLRGKVGSGFDEATLDWWRKKLPSLEIDAPAAAGSVTRHGPRHWVEPTLVVNVEYAGLSEGGTLRFPVYRGLRADVDPADCYLAPSGGEPPAPSGTKSSNAPAPPPSPRVRAEAVVNKATLSNQSKVFWPTQGFTKGDLCDYYASVSPHLLPFLQDRPVVLVRYPDGIPGKHFFQWNVPRGTPSWIRSLELTQDGGDEKQPKRVFVIDDLDGLLHLANLGCIPLHVLARRAISLDTCDFLTLDFDLKGAPLTHAITLAQTLRRRLGELGLSGCPKTSGQSGLHVLVPLGASVTFDTARLLVELLGRILVTEHPDIATLERRLAAREGRVYVDTGQTGRGRTIVAPYSVRAVEDASVSTPLRWDEVGAGLDPARFDLMTVPARVARDGDPWSRFFAVTVDLPATLKRLETIVRSLNLPIRCGRRGRMGLDEARVPLSPRAFLARGSACR
ncbi:MAG: hypothetical protein AAGA56_24360, partial [Myxococcota bacterium]